MYDHLRADKIVKQVSKRRSFGRALNPNVIELEDAVANLVRVLICGMYWNTSKNIEEASMTFFLISLDSVSELSHATSV